MVISVNDRKAIMICPKCGSCGLLIKCNACGHEIDQENVEAELDMLFAKIKKQIKDGTVSITTTLDDLNLIIH